MGFLFIPSLVSANSANCYPSVVCPALGQNAYGTPILCRQAMPAGGTSCTQAGLGNAFSCTKGCYTTTSTVPKAPTCPVVTMDGGTIMPALTLVRSGNFARLAECGTDLIHQWFNGFQISSDGEISYGGPEPIKLIDNVVIGSGNTASGLASLAAGYLSSATGRQSASFGTVTKAQGDRSFATGQGTTASGINSFSAGWLTKAEGAHSISAGESTVASGSHSMSLGVGTIAKPYASVAIGRYNVESGNSSGWTSNDPIFIIGNGTGNSARNNAMTVFQNGNVAVGTSLPMGRVHGQHANGQFGVLGHFNSAVYGQYDFNNYGYIGGSNTGAYGAGTLYGIRGVGDTIGVRGDGDTGVRGDGDTRGVWGSGETGVYASGTDYGIYSRSGSNYFAEIIEAVATTDASGTAGTGVIEVGGNLRIDGNEIITNTDTTLYLQHDNNGDLRVDSSTLVVDASANRVGIGTTTPNAGLEIKSSGWPNSFILLDTNAINQDAGIRLHENSSPKHHIYNMGNDSDKLRIKPEGGEGIVMNQTGFVGIGDLNPANRLSVNGKATATAFGTVKVKHTTANGQMVNLVCDSGHIAISCGGYASGLVGISPTTDASGTPTGCSVSKIGSASNITVYATCWDPSR